MAITRSQIARQLLAEGGVSLDDAKAMAPEGEFLAYINPKEAGILRSMGGSGKMTPMGIPSFTEDEEDQDYMNAPDYSSLDLEEQAAVDRGEPTAQMSTTTRDLQGYAPGDNLADLKAPSFFQNLGTTLKNFETDSRMNRIGRGILTTPGAIKSAFGFRNVSPELLQTLADDYTQGGLYSEGLVGGDISLANAARTFEGLEDLGVDLTGDIRSQVADISRSKFAERFGPKTKGGEGGDNEPIKKLKAPITEKKEEPKDEFADILKFYGARFATGGSTGFKGSPELGGRGTEETYGFDQSGPAGDIGGGDEPPTIRDDGTEPPMLPGGRGIDVGALQKQGLTPAEIATVFNDYYGLDAGPAVTGPLGALGTAPGGRMGTGVATFGQVPGGLLGVGKGTTGTTGTTGTGFTIDDIADKVFDTGSLGGIARDAIRSNKEAIEAAAKENLGLKDGGDVRQNYGLGSIVKKAVGAVKKVAKSPIGKLALIGGLGYLGATKTGFGADLLTSFNKLDPIKKALLIGGAGLSLSPFVTQDEEEEKLPTVANTDPEITKFLEFYGGPRRFAEDGGDIEDAPMKMASYGYDDAMSDTYQMFLQMKEKDLIPPDMKFDEFLQEVVPEMSKKQGIERAEAAKGGMMEKDEMLDLGGKEMDLRGGGFVPLGEYEKKDDVPARLSKNEFVFTADAVRAAGGGSVDKGADVMYKTMKTLENKVA